ncbi:MAG: hypothetical protein ACM3S5_00760 [Rhodospirillales bacterium]
MISDPVDDLDRAISEAAAGLREEWASPDLWPRIARALAAEERRRARSRFWWPVAAAAAVLAASILVMRPAASVPEQENTFISEQALADAERAEQECEQSIENLSRMAGPRLVKASTPKAASYAEKLIILDAEIEALRADVDHNRYHAHLRSALAGLYQQKRETLQEFLDYVQEN